eukprot:COSAG05_NODE_2421_length_3083_cov_4.710791_1_plen_172_part_10
MTKSEERASDRDRSLDRSKDRDRSLDRSKDLSNLVPSAIASAMLTLEAVAALTHALRTDTPASTINAGRLGELIASNCAQDAETGTRVARSLAHIFGDGTGEMAPTVLACGLGLLSDTSPSERLNLAFHGCDNDSLGFLSLPQLSQFVRAFTCIFVATVEAMVDAAGRRYSV